MKNITRIHASKQPVRRHFLNEWLQERGMEPMDLVDALNEASPDGSILNKSQVYRWLGGSLPQVPTQIRIAAALELIDPETGEPKPEMLLRHPDQDWMARFFEGRADEERERIKRAMELAWPKKTGTQSE